MESIIVSTVTSVIEKLAPMLADQTDLGWFGLRKQVEEMQGELRCMNSILTTPGGSDTPWAGEARELACDAEDCIDLYYRFCGVRHGSVPRRLGARSFRRSSRFLKSLHVRFRIAKKMRSIKDEAARLNGLKDHYQQTEFRATAPVPPGASAPCRSAGPFFEEAQLIGMEKRRHKLKAMLLGSEQELTAVSVVGMTGAGKSTLAWNLYTDESFTKQFQCCAWVRVPELSAGSQAILSNLVRQLTKQRVRDQMLELEDHLVMELRGFLQNKRYIIMLDDLRDRGVWEDVTAAFPDNSNGSRILVTSVHTTVAATINTACIRRHQTYEMPFLDDDEAWDLFCRRAFHGADPNFRCPSHLENVAKGIVKMCDRLPLAIVTMGGLLSNKPTHEWEKLHDSPLTKLGTTGPTSNIRRIVSLGYDDLPAKLKACLLYFSVFRRVRPMRLMRMWMAEGLVTCVGRRTPEEVAEDYLHELIDRSLVQVEKDLSGRLKFCFVHGFMRKILESKCEEQNFFTLLHDNEGFGSEGQQPQEEADEQQSSGRFQVRRLSTYGTSPQICSSMVSMLGSRTKSKHLRSLIMAVGAPAQSHHLSRSRSKFELLRVLDLEGASSVRMLPAAISSSCLLRYLSLRNTGLDSLPNSLSKLANLETLDIRGTQVRRLPATVTRIQRLRHLLLPSPMEIHVDWYRTSSAVGVKVPSGIGRLRSLLKLALVDCEHVVDELSRLTQLQKLGVRRVRKNSGSKLADAISNMSHLRSLALLSAYPEEPLDLGSMTPSNQLERLFLAGPLLAVPTWFCSLHSVSRMVLLGCRLEDEQVIDHLAALHSLMDLSLIQAYAQPHLRFKACGFRSLRCLHLSMLNDLDLITLEEGTMPALLKISIWSCKQLETVPSGIEHLKNLSELHLLGMPPGLTERLKKGSGEDAWRVAHIGTVLESRLVQASDGKWSAFVDDNLLVASELEQCGEGEDEHGLPYEVAASASESEEL